MKLPVSKCGKKLGVIVGFQGPVEKGKRGLETVLRLDKSMEEEVKSMGREFLTEEIVDYVKKGADKDKAELLSNILTGGESDDEFLREEDEESDE